MNGPLYEYLARDQQLISNMVPPVLAVRGRVLLAHQLVNAKDATRRQAVLEDIATERKDYDQARIDWQKRLSTAGPEYAV